MAGHEDVYDVLIDVGFVELWIVQTSKPGALRLANEIAELLGITADREIRRTADG